MLAPEEQVELKQEMLNVISTLLQYPDAWWEEMEVLQDLVKEYQEICPAEADSLAGQMMTRAYDLTCTSSWQAMAKLLEVLAEKGLEDANETYVSLFDFNETGNLYLTYYTDKDDRARGEKLIALKEIYQGEDFEMFSDDLPDYLPLVLEFLSMSSVETAGKIYEEYNQAMEEIAQGLGKHGELGQAYGDLVLAARALLDTVSWEKL